MKSPVDCVTASLFECGCLCCKLEFPVGVLWLDPIHLGDVNSNGRGCDTVRFRLRLASTVVNLAFSGHVCSSCFRHYVFVESMNANIERLKTNNL